MSADAVPLSDIPEDFTVNSEFINTARLTIPPIKTMDPDLYSISLPSQPSTPQQPSTPGSVSPNDDEFYGIFPVKPFKAFFPNLEVVKNLNEEGTMAEKDLYSIWIAWTAGLKRDISEKNISFLKDIEREKEIINILKRFGVEKQVEVLKTRKICIRPTEEQRNILLKLMNTSRWTYNQCVKVIKDGNSSGYSSRNYMGIFQELQDMLEKFKRNSGVFSFLKDITTSEPLPEIKHDFQITNNKLGHWYFLVQIPIEKRSNNGAVALDP
ncbi:13502_t:CDS:2, partial [Racocetra fulgida]